MSRKKRAILSATAHSSTSGGVRSREYLKPCVLEELWSIWHADPRVPSLKSRRSWAISRNANPRLVTGWFHRRKACARKAGQSVAHGSYDLPLHPPTASKREPIEPDFDAIPDLPSDDTLAYPDVNDLEASSDTVFDEDTLIDSKGPETPAYTEAPHQFCSEYLHLEPAKLSLYAQDSRDRDTLLLENISFPVCNQGQGHQSDFTCILCSSESAQDAIQPGSSTTSDLRADSTTSGSNLGLSPARPVVPLLLRTLVAVPPDHPASVQDWSAIEDELARLANDGKLDFSFLDVPRLAFMDLID